MDKLNPGEQILQMTGTSKESGLINKEDNRIKELMTKWLEMYSSLLEEGKTLPVDLIGRASEIAKLLRSGKS